MADQVGCQPDVVYYDTMGWETRQRAGRYYTRSRRAGGPTVREDNGIGQAAEPVALLDEREQEEQEAARTDDRDRRAQIEASDDLGDALCRAADALAQAALLAAGSHQHDRGA